MRRNTAGQGELAHVGFTGCLCFGIAFIIGCGGGEKGPELAPVSGVVTLDGKPVANASILFNPTAGGQPATGMTDASGKYTLRTKKPGDGAIVGAHGVGITMTKAPTATKKKTVATADPSNPEVSGPLDNAPPPPKKQDFVVPEKFNSPFTSGLTATVKSGPNDIPFDLKSK